MRIGEIRSEEDILTALKTAVNDRLEARRPFETLWWNNIALIAGDHYAQWNPNSATFVDRDPSGDPDLGDKQPRMVVNQALSVFRTELSKLTKNHPRLDVMANSDDATDLAATKVAAKVLPAMEWRFKLPANRKEVLTWTIQCGLGAHYIGWDWLDENQGYRDIVVDPNTNEATFNPARIKQLEEMEKAGEISLTKEQYPLGDIDFKVYSPFQLLPDPHCKNFQQLKNLITSEVADIDVVKDIYGSAARDLKPSDGAGLSTMQTRMLQRAGLSHPRDQVTNDGCEVFTFWLLPNVFRQNDFLKNGLYVRWSQDKLLDWSAFPYADGQMPFAFYQHIPAPTTIWPDSVINHVRELNLELDKTLSQLIATKDFMSNPMWRIATQHRVKGKVKAVAGAVLRYVHSPNIPPPEPIQGLEMPAQTEDLITILKSQMLEISGQSDITRGNVPSGVRSGVAVGYLQEEDDSKIAPTVDNLENCIAYEGTLILERVSQFYSTRRTMGYYRRDGEFDVIKFRGADLKNNTSVVAQPGSGMPKSKAQRQQFVLQLVELGKLTDPKRIEEELELGYSEADLDDLQKAQARRENNLMLKGLSVATFDHRGELEEAQDAPVALPVKKWMNHRIHLEEHYTTMSTEEFDQLAISHPEVVRLFDEHTNLHEQAIQEEAQQQMAMLNAAKGAPDGQPAGVQPTSGITAPQDASTGGAATAQPPQPTQDQQPVSSNGGG